ncbi:XK-related protein 6 [Parasteatoda tepidariorum]|nr:XK-related protein 6 [Parasteatoda tepidariorum]
MINMTSQNHNGSSLQSNLKDLDDSDQEVNGKIKVIIHQDLPEVKQKKKNAERPHFITDGNKTIAEPDDIITPLSEESSPARHWNEDKFSVELSENKTSSYPLKLFLCCGDLIDPGSFTVGRLFGIVSCFLFYVGNLVSDAMVCYFLFLHGDMLWFSLVTAFTIIPTVILNCISYHLSINKMIVKRSIWDQSESYVVSVAVALLHLSQFGVLARYLGYIFLHELEYLWVVFCPNQKRKDYDHNSGKYIELPYLPYLFMVEAMLQCLPQLIIQLYILIEGDGVLTPDTSQMLVISVIVSFLNLTRLLTLCMHTHKNFNTSWSGLFFSFMWYFFTNISRVVSFSLFMVKFTLGFVILCLFHWVIMSVWAVSALTPSIPCCTFSGFCKNCYKYLKGLLVGFMYLLCFMELRIVDDSEKTTMPSQYLYIFFYSVIFLENSVLIVLWYIYCSYVWYSVVALCVTFLSFFIGVLLMYVYYRHFYDIVTCKQWPNVFLFPSARNRVV